MGGALQKGESMINEFAAKTGKIGDSEASLLEALKLRTRSNSTRKGGGVSSLRRDEDMRVSANQGCFSAPQTLGVKWGESSSWFQPELLKVPEDKLRDGSAAGSPGLPTLLR